MQPTDRNRLDRAPTRGERWVGLILSALLALIFLPSAAFVFTWVMGTKSDRLGITIFASVLTALGLVGAFLFYRIAFTTPQAASVRAHRIYAVVAVIVTATMVAVAIVIPATAAQTATSVSLLFGSLGVLAGTQKRGHTDDKRRTRSDAL
jgi:predicted membrane channel-forming protein YqfA (hemolysin III family)